MIATLYPLSKFKGQTLRDNITYVSKNLNLSDVSNNSNIFIFIAQEHGVVFYPIGCGIIEERKIISFIEDDYCNLKEQLSNSLKEQKL